MSSVLSCRYRPGAVEARRGGGELIDAAVWGVGKVSRM